MKFPNNRLGRQNAFYANMVLTAMMISIASAGIAAIFLIYSLGLKFFSADSAFHKASSPPVSGPRCLGNTIFILHIKKHAKKGAVK
jgi:hypothetical protein